MRFDALRAGTFGFVRSAALAALLLAGAPMVGHAQTMHARALGPDAESIDSLAERYPFEYPLASGEALRFDANVPSPAAFLGRELGARFTAHHDVTGYIDALAQASDRVTVERYGSSWQGRPLSIVTITSPQNHARLDEILARNLELTDPTQTDPARALQIASSNPAIVWLSYNVHGNEGSCSEAALQVAYTLAAAENETVERWLQSVVVVIDPVLNPDGRARYMSFFENKLGTSPDPNPFTSEHREPWPSGRSNHYLFDLNRDWVWVSQAESRARLQAYRRYMPQLHIDYHEQGYNSPHFFGPGDTPYSANIPETTKDMLALYGDHNAMVFDTLGLPFATRERFDYLYPGYGKVLPVYHGAIGLLTEQAGHGRGGLAINVDPFSGPDPQGGYTLTLRERIRNHFLTSISYVETTAANREAQLERFYDFFATANQPRQPLTITVTDADGDGDEREVSTPMPAAYAFMPSNDPGKLRHLHDLLSSHGIRIRVLEDSVTTRRALNYRPKSPGMPAPGEFDAREEITLPSGAWLVSASQPMGYLARTLLDRTTYVEDIATYDITAWSAPLMIGLDGYELFASIDEWNTRSFNVARDLPGLPAGAFEERTRDADDPLAPRAGGVAWIVPSDQLRFPVALGLAGTHNLFARLTGDPIEHGDRTHAEGSLLLHTARNPSERIDAYLQELAKHGLAAFSIDRGDPGVALGNNAHRRFVQPRIMLLTGSPLSSLSTGHTWHMLDHQFPTPHHRVRVEHFPPRDLAGYNVIVLPSAWGGLSREMSERDVERLSDWVRSGGTLVALGSSAHWASRELLDLDDDAEDLGRRPQDEYARDDEADDQDEDEDLSVLTYEQREERGHYDRVPGAVLRADVDMTHPLAFGADAKLAFHVFSAEPLPVRNTGFVVARFATGRAEAGMGPPSGTMSTRAALTVERSQAAYEAASQADSDEDAQAGELFAEQVLAGWISPENAQQLAGTPAVTHHRLGGGHVVAFVVDPTNRAMNQAGMRLLMNAITKGPSLSPTLQPLGAGESDQR